MSLQLSLRGSLDAGPPAVTGAGFPGASLSMPMGLTEEPKLAEVASGVQSLSLNSAGAFVALAGVSSSGPVRRGTTFRIQSLSAIRVRLTFDDGAGGSYQSVVPLLGTLLVEPPDLEALIGVEARGVSMIEYFVAGPS